MKKMYHLTTVELTSIKLLSNVATVCAAFGGLFSAFTLLSVPLDDMTKLVGWSFVSFVLGFVSLVMLALSIICLVWIHREIERIKAEHKFQEGTTPAESPPMEGADVFSFVISGRRKNEVDATTK